MMLRLYRVRLFHPEGDKFQYVWEAIILAKDEEEAICIVARHNEYRPKRERIWIEEIKRKAHLLSVQFVGTSIPEEKLSDHQQVTSTKLVPRIK